jgi:hypothetical protein
MRMPQRLRRLRFISQKLPSIIQPLPSRAIIREIIDSVSTDYSVIRYKTDTSDRHFRGDDVCLVQVLYRITKGLAMGSDEVLIHTVLVRV